MNENTITLVGNLTRDPEVKLVGAGNTSQARLGLAVNRRWFDKKKDEWQEQVSFFNLVAWGDLADHIDGTLTKGTRVIVVGRLEQRSWETDEGEKRSVVEVIVDAIGPELRWATAEVRRVEGRGQAAGTADGGYAGEPF